MDTIIKLPIVEYKINKSFSIYRRLFLIIPLIYFISLFITEDKNNLNGKLFLLILILYIVCGFFFKKPHTIIIGYITFEKEFFKCIHQDIIKKYPIKDLNNIIFTYSGYNGRTKTSSGLMTDTGGDNKLSFVYKKQLIQYRIYIEKHEYIALLKRFFKQIDSLGIEVTMKNLAGDKIKF